MPIVTYYVALPFTRLEQGGLAPGQAVDCPSLAAALQRAEALSRAPANAGAIAFFYTSDPEKLERAGEELHVGNLYVTRKCTGAMIGAHPFGGFNMSGTDTKAGGKDYLLLLMQGKSIAEKVS